MSGPKLADALGRVIALRAELETDAQHKKRWAALKQWQIERLRKTYADLLANPRYKEAAEFFLDELYGAKDVDSRDSEAQKVAPKLARMLPSRAIDALLLAVQLEEMAERLRSAGFSPILRHRDLASQPSDTIEERPGHAGDGDTGGELNE
jgi:hypothetical protein